ncbi:MAG: Rne/Rng family ribonuclease [Deltaproteobacteria bacterium]|nr:Rne/Rng family ribonuclease [Deltaproteobacteria bacterium]TLN04778.1 MAG: Rne/Rng family ribonuclease [bacterium]
MAKKMLINVMHPEEARVAIVEEGHLIELDIETAGKEQTRGNVYKGVVVRVEPGLQAAFIDIGMKKLGFLQMGEIHPDNWQWRDDLPEEQKNRRPRIQEILRRGQELNVQVEKGEREGKGAALTTYISLPGRYMVLMPGSDSCGISRKVENESERKALKEVVAELEIPEGVGYIIRTEAVGKRKTELSKDLHYLLKLYASIKERSAELKAPALIYQESDLVIRTIRDYFSSEIDEVLVDSKDVYKQARAFFKDVMPKYENIVKLHQEKRPIFAKYQLEEQIDLIYEKKVPLKSGGSIVIDPTEALVSIDVNSGKSTGEKGVEDTAFKTNMEAAEEVARQLRLRDLGGLIVIDFIDMRDRKHKAEVEKALKTALKADKARVSVDKISQFGLLEMSRQRIKQTINEGSYLECPHCGGHGKVKSVEAMALSFLRKVHTAAARGTLAEVRGGLPLEVAYYLLNRKKRELAQIETDYDIEVTVKGKPSFMMNEMELELIKKDKHAQQADHARVSESGLQGAIDIDKTEDSDEAQLQTLPVEGEETKAKRKRRRGKKKPQPNAETPVTEETVETVETAEQVHAAPVSDESLEAASSEEQEESDSPAEAVKKKRRRRRKRPAKSAPVVEAGSEEALPVEEGEPPAKTPPEEVAPPETPEATEEPPKKKPRKPRAPRKPKAAATEVTDAVPESAPKETTSAKAEKPAEPSKEIVVPSAEQSTVDTPATAEEAPEKPKRKRTPRKKKEPVADEPEQKE